MFQASTLLGGKKPDLSEKTNILCVCVEVHKTPDPHSGVGADIRELLTVPQCDLLHNARDSLAA